MIYHEAGQYRTSYRADMVLLPIAQDRRALLALLVAAFVLVPAMSLAGIPPFAGDYLFNAILIPFLILALAALGLNVLVGYCGQISLGSGAFMAVGAYTAFNLAVRVPEIPIVLAMLGGGIVAAMVGTAIGLPSLRIKGLYLAVSTLAAQFFFDWVFVRIPWVTNRSSSGSVTAPDLSFLGFPLTSSVGRYLFVLSVVVLVTLGIKNLVRGSLGRQWMATRDMDIAAEIMGIRPLYAKLTAFAVSSFVIGIAGTLWGFAYVKSWEPAAFSIDRSFSLLFMVIIGGLGSITGTFLGAAFILLTPIVLSQLPAMVGLPLSTATIAHLEVGIFGLLIIVFLIAEPHGLARLWLTAKEKLRIWPFPH